MTDELDQRSLFDGIGLTRIVAISIAVSMLLTAGTGVALAQEDQTIDDNDSIFCNKDSSGDWIDDGSSTPAETFIGSAIETLIQLMFALGIVGVFIVWQGSAIGSIVTMDRSQKRKLKQYRGSAVKSFAILLLIGPIFTVMQGAMDLQSAGCISLSPF